MRGMRDALTRKLGQIKLKREEVRVRLVKQVKMREDLLGSEGWRILRERIDQAVSNLSNRLTNADPNNPAAIAGLQGRIKALRWLVALVEEPVRSDREN